MKTPVTLTNKGLDWGPLRAEPGRELLHLVIAWSREEPHRIGEAAPIDKPCVLGRGAGSDGDPLPRVAFYQLRPLKTIRKPPLAGLRISRRQLEISPLGEDALEVRSVGRLPLLLNGEVVQRGIARPGDTVSLEAALVMLVVRRGPGGDPLRGGDDTHPFPFGEADPHGIVGESPAAWALRDTLAFVGEAGGHALVLGESGVGKELAARAIHALSSRRHGAFVARNAATLPEGLVDAELFGTAKGYPNAGSPERRGLIGEADGGTLFLDEIAEFPLHLQARLLRVLDTGGEYQRLGDARVRWSDFRLIAATNRPPEALKHDLAARLAIRVEVPGLAQRREDIPLLLRHLLASTARTNPGLSSRYFEPRADAPAEPRIDPQVIEALLRHHYTHHLRELAHVMWAAMSKSRDSFLTLPPELLAELRLDRPPAERRAEEPSDGGGDDEEAAQEAAEEWTTEPGAVGRAEIEAALAQAGGSVTRAAWVLGLKNRFALYYLMKRHGLAARKDDKPTKA